MFKVHVPARFQPRTYKWWDLGGPEFKVSIRFLPAPFQTLFRMPLPPLSTKDQLGQILSVTVETLEATYCTNHQAML